MFESFEKLLKEGFECLLLNYVARWENKGSIRVILRKDLSLSIYHFVYPSWMNSRP